MRSHFKLEWTALYISALLGEGAGIERKLIGGVSLDQNYNSKKCVEPLKSILLNRPEIMYKIQHAGCAQ